MRSSVGNIASKATSRSCRQLFNQHEVASLFIIRLEKMSTVLLLAFLSSTFSGFCLLFLLFLLLLLLSNNFLFFNVFVVKLPCSSLEISVDSDIFVLFGFVCLSELKLIFSRNSFANSFPSIPILAVIDLWSEIKLKKTCSV